MTEDTEQISQTKQRQRTRKRRCFSICCLLLIVFLVLISITALVLALTVFKTKQPRTKLVSAKLDGVSPRITFPVINIKLNITLDLQLLVENRNHASFKHGAGKSFISYRGKQFGEADISPGFIPAMGSATIPCRLTIQADEILPNITALVGDVLDGQLVVDTRTRIPGRVNFLKIFKKHAVATSECHFTIAVLALKIQSQECKNKAKL